MSVEIAVPQLGESVVEATIGRWLKREGEAVAAGEPLVELETDKVNVEIPAESSGVLQRILKQEGETVNVGEAVAVLGDGAAPAPKEPASAPAAAPAPAAAAPPAKSNGAVASAPAAAPPAEAPHASPVARALASQNQLDLGRIKGSGPGGKITKQDVADYLERQSEAPHTARMLEQQAAEKTAPAAPAASSSGATFGDRPVKRIRMSRRRQTIALRLKEALNTAAMLTTFNEVDMTAIMEIRKRRKDQFKEKHGVNLGFMSFFAKAVVNALRAFPNINAEIDGSEIVQKQFYDIGIAVSTEEGLVVPIVRDADKKSFAQIEQDIVDLATRARTGALTLPELQGGSFTITNGGVFGSLLSTPILNTPQVGILGMHKIQDRPVVVDGQIVARPMMYLALSYDHRIVDGAEAVRFLVHVKDSLEDPTSLMLEL
jgi:2-oxoglutarate dehydrogenase E2 component (dihydrolipoamide succinyltransferase)